jgi:hypothetical protein
MVPESDGGYTRTVTNRPTRSRRPSPAGFAHQADFTELGGEGCGGSAQIIVAGGSALSFVGALSRANPGQRFILPGDSRRCRLVSIMVLRLK